MLRKFFQSVPRQTKCEAVADKKLSVLAWCVFSLLSIVLLLAVISLFRKLVGLINAGAEMRKASVASRISQYV